MSNEIEPYDGERSVDRNRWLTLLQQEERLGSLFIEAEEELPLLVQSYRGGFTLPPNFRWRQPEWFEHPTLIIHIETEQALTASALGELLTLLDKGVRRKVKRNDRERFRLEVVELDTGSYFLKVVVPVAGLGLAFGNFLMDVYGNFKGDAAAQRPIAASTSKIVIEQGADAVTFYSSDGLTIRIDHLAASSYLDRRSAKPGDSPTEEIATLPASVLAPLRLPAATEKAERVGSGRIVTVEGTFYVEVEGREGALVMIDDMRKDPAPLIAGDFYNLKGRFEIYRDGFPRRFILDEARPL